MRQSVLGVVVLAGLAAVVIVYGVRGLWEATAIDADAPSTAHESDELQLKVLRTHIMIDDMEIGKLCGSGWASENGMVTTHGESTPVKNLRWFRGLAGVCFDGRRFSNEDMRVIHDIVTLEIVRFHKCDFPDDFEWQMFSEMSLKYIEVSGECIRKDQLDQLLRSLPHTVVYINLADSPLADSHVDALRTLPRLECVDISQNTTLSNDGFKRLCDIQSIKVIRVAELSTHISRSTKEKVKKSKLDLRLDEV